jgi:phage terminase large subunit-like protein
VSPRDLLKELNRADTREADWRRLHLNQWTATKEAWLPAGRWRALTAETEIPRGADIYVAVDAAKKYDTSACAWAYRTDSGGIIVRVRVWSAREGIPFHEFVPGGRIRNDLVEAFIAETLATQYRVREVVYDPRYFDTQGERLADRGLVVAEFPQASAAMADAYQHFYEACLAGTIVHDGDPVFAAHVDAAAAVLTESGWRVYKLRSSNPIDALVASAMARERAARDAAGPRPFAFIAH